jgi:hypothetical protein
MEQARQAYLEGLNIKACDTAACSACLAGTAVCRSLLAWSPTVGDLLLLAPGLRELLLCLI